MVMNNNNNNNNNNNSNDNNNNAQVFADAHRRRFLVNNPMVVTSYGMTCGDVMNLRGTYVKM